MNLADEVLNLRSHATPRADAIELAVKVRALESERDEAVALLRRWNKSTTVALCNATSALLARIDARAKATTGTG